jgi:type II secretory pathway component PulM
MTEPIINSTALREPRNKQLLIIIGVALLALLVILALWQTTGTHGAKRDLASANERVVGKQREVDEARRVLDEKLAELRAVRAEADVQATRLGGAVDEQIKGTVDDARAEAGGDVRLDPGNVYYIRDRDGRFVPVTRP